MFKKLLSMLKKVPLIVYIIISLIASIMVLKKLNMKPIEIIKKENFAPVEENKQEKKPVRHMWNTSGIKRNSSYDIRAEESNIPYQPEKTGSTQHGDLKDNLTNQKLIEN